MAATNQTSLLVHEVKEELVSAMQGQFYCFTIAAYNHKIALIGCIHFHGVRLVLASYCCYYVYGRCP